MATFVSQPPDFYTALRNVEYTFNMPSIGSGDIELLFRYRLKDSVNNIYLTDWKYYKPVVDGQDIVIDFYRDLFGVVSFEAPPFGLANTIHLNTTIIKTIIVEYGEREIDRSIGCQITDTVDGTTTEIDVINGIWRPWETPYPATGVILSNRPTLYEVNKQSSDWLYVAGTYYFYKVYYNSQGTIIGGAYLTATETFPGSSVSIVPIGFQAAPSATSTIRVFAKQTGVPLLQSADHYCTLKATEPKDEDTIITDIYFSNHRGGIDLMSFDKVENKESSSTKSFNSARYDTGLSDQIQRGQMRVLSNSAFPTINLVKQFQRLTYKETDWLDSFVGTSNVWIRQVNEAGVETLFKGVLSDGGYQTYGDEVVLTAAVTFSEELLNPI